MIWRDYLTGKAILFTFPGGYIQFKHIWAIEIFSIAILIKGTPGNPKYKHLLGPFYKKVNK